MRAYTYTGPAPVTYTWGVVAPGAIAYFLGRPPDSDWTEYVAPAAVAAEESADAESGAVPAAEAGSDPTTDAALAARPNKAASAEDWRAYADQHGGFQEATGKSPMDPATTRKEIVDHYTGPDGADQ